MRAQNKYQKINSHHKSFQKWDQSPYRQSYLNRGHMTSLKKKKIESRNNQAIGQVSANVFREIKDPFGNKIESIDAGSV